VAGLRWGIMGTGGIAATMCETLQQEGAEVVAIGSARLEAAERFSHEWQVPHVFDSHRGVAMHGEVDVVYVATTNDRHFGNVLDCVELGKPVLCEKPIALNAEQARLMLRAARSGGIFAMDAMWMRFLPFVTQLDQLLATGAIGDVRNVSANLSFVANDDWSRRWLSRELGGGALLDLGIYPLTLVHHLLGPPTDTVAAARLAPTGVDFSCRVISDHGGEAAATMTASLTAETGNDAIVGGSEGLIRIHSPFHHSGLLTVERHGRVVASYPCGYEGHGFRFEIAEAERCVRDGLVESPVRPHSETIAVMEWLDVIRAQCGIFYPQDPE